MTSTALDPYLNFRDNTREAMEFYDDVFGGTLDMRPFRLLGAHLPRIGG
jgi:PhnB protein